jgi:competence protein ComEC
VPDEVPAALPLTGLVLGLACGAWLVHPWLAIGGLLVCALLSRRTLFVFAALGVLLASRPAPRVTFPPDAFVRVDAPLDRDWSSHGAVSMLKVARFEADGMAVGRELSIYVRFAPEPIALRTTVHAEGFVRENERGELTMSVKSPRLLRYSGTLHWFDPQRWNRAAAMRIAPLAREHPDEVALAAALALGRGEALDERVRDGFRRGGTYHLLVFSGLQIALAAALISFLLRWLRKPRAADVLLLTFACLAPLFIGPTASVSRASIGIGLYALSRLLQRPTSAANLWCVAALIRLLIAPHDLTDTAFQLTYAGAGALIFVARPFAKWRFRWLSYAVAAELAITPLTLFHFHQYAAGGSLTTILLTPLISLMLAVSAALCVVPSVTLIAALTLLHRLCVLLNDLAAHASGVFAAPPVWSMIAAGFGALLALSLARGTLRASLIAASLVIPLLAIPSPPETPRMIVFDVGQGDAIAVTDGAHTILVDGGPAHARLLPLLADAGIRRLDAVFLSHAHPDHCGGVPRVLDRMQVGALYVSPRRFIGDCAGGLRGAHPLHDGDALTFGAMRVVVHAVPRTFRRAAENNASVVLRIQLGRTRILLTGDVEREAEALLAERDLRAGILKVAHHGSRSSSTAVMLDAVCPRVAVISCGRGNAFGHPHREVLDALRERHVRVLRTDRDGSTTLTLTR